MTLPHNLRISVDYHSLSLGKTAATGIIFIDSDKGAFPEREWSDFPLVILKWWIDELRSVCFGGKQSAKLRFMDGPYHVSISVARSQPHQVETVEVGDYEMNITLTRRSLECLLGNLLSVAERFLKSNRSLASGDYRELQESLSRS